MDAIFSGIKVLDFTSNLAGPGSTAILADFGAEVIKIERPVDGDDIRSIAPRLDGQAIFHLFSNRNSIIHWIYHIVPRIFSIDYLFHNHLSK